MNAYIRNVISGQQDLCDRETEMREKTVPKTHQSTLPNRGQGLEFIYQLLEIRQSVVLCVCVITCIRGKCFGLSSISILRKPTPTAPDETSTTLCPSR